MRPPQHPAALALLALPALAYEHLVRWRNRLYDRPGMSRRASLPVLSVGNLTVGGTGKTPIVAWLARQLVADGLRPAVVSRGYGGRAGRGPVVVSEGSGPLCGVDVCGDEPFLLARSLEGVMVIVGSDRFGATRAARERGSDVVLLDDGFQHRRLGRDLDIVLLDAGNPFGNSRMLPAGPLREPPSSLGRAGVILITRSRAEDELERIERFVRKHNPRAPILGSGHRVEGFVGPTGEAAPAPRRVVGFCGIGNPDRFRIDLLSSGIDLVAFRPYLDHHRYTPGDLRHLRRLAADHEACLVTTEKDAARLGPEELRATAPPLLALRIVAEVFEPEPLLQRVRLALGRAAA